MVYPYTGALVLLDIDSVSIWYICEKQLQLIATHNHFTVANTTTTVQP